MRNLATNSPSALSSAANETLPPSASCSFCLEIEPTKAPMNVGTGMVRRTGYIRQNPTASTKARASSTVRMGLPLRRHFSLRSCWRSDSVINSASGFRRSATAAPTVSLLKADGWKLDSLERLLNVLYRIPQYDGPAVGAGHGVVGFREFGEEPVHFILLERHVDLDGGVAGDGGGDAGANLFQV